MPNGVLEDNLTEETGSIVAIEIFRVGDYGDKGKYDIAKLKAMVIAYDPAEHEAPVTLNHAEDGPAYGWVEKIYLKGKSIFADLKDVPRSLIGAIRAGRYKKRSCEIWKDWLGTGKPMLAAVTFLGAAPPHVRGMEDPSPEQIFAISDQPRYSFGDNEAPDSFEQSGPALKFIAPTDDPFPKNHGVIEREERTDDMTGHHHMAWMDEARDGFTSIPLELDQETFELREEEGGHVHQIEDGRVLPAGEILHTHPLVMLELMSETNPKGRVEIMAKGTDKKKTGEGEAKVVDAPAVEAVTPEAFAALKADLASSNTARDQLAGQVNVMRDQAIQGAELSRFDATFAEASALGTVSPADHDRKLAIFTALPLDAADGSDKTTFGEGEKAPKLSPREAFLLDMKEGGAEGVIKVPMGVAKFSGGQGYHVTPKAPDENSRKLNTAAVKLSGEQKIDFSAAIIQIALDPEAHGLTAEEAGS